MEVFEKCEKGVFPVKLILTTNITHLCINTTLTLFRIVPELCGAQANLLFAVLISYMYKLKDSWDSTSPLVS